MNQSIDTSTPQIAVEQKPNRALRRLARHKAKQIEERERQQARMQKMKARAAIAQGQPNPEFIRKESVIIKNQNFRDGTQTELRDVVFSFIMAGKKGAALGDMLCWLPAIKYIAENYNFVCGHLIVPEFFADIAEHVIGKYSHWKIHIDKIPDYLQDGFPLNQPLMHPINATGMHLVDLGFTYFLHTAQVPIEAKNYIRLDFSNLAADPNIVSKLHGKRYAVMTPISEGTTRTMLPSVFNGIQDHLLSLGITPVYLGKRDMKGRHLGISPACDLSKGIDLMDQTNLMQAADIMQKAEMVIGIDNGLLHLAATTDATILFGYTIAGPAQRRPYRKYGDLYELYGDKEKIKCLFCQESVKFFPAHHFSDCLYKENEPACIKALNLESWVATIDLAIKEKADGT